MNKIKASSGTRTTPLPHFVSATVKALKTMMLTSNVDVSRKDVSGERSLQVGIA